VKRLTGDDLGHDGPVPDPSGVKLSNRLLGDALLLGSMVKDHRAVLRADIPTLAVERGRVMNAKKHLEDFAEADSRGVEGDLDDLRVAGTPGADLMVRGRRHAASRVAGRDAFDAAQVLEHRLQAPETAATQGSDLAARRGVGLPLWFPRHGYLLVCSSNRELSRPAGFSPQIPSFPGSVPDGIMVWRDAERTISMGAREPVSPAGKDWRPWHSMRG